MMRRRQFPDVLEDRPRRRNVTESQIIVECSGVDVAREAGMAKQRMKLRGERKVTADQRVKQRLLADTIACEEQHSRAVVPEGECEHSSKTLHTVRALLLPGVNDHLCIALRRETVAKCL